MWWSVFTSTVLCPTLSGTNHAHPQWMMQFAFRHPDQAWTAENGGASSKVGWVRFWQDAAPAVGPGIRVESVLQRMQGEQNWAAHINGCKMPRLWIPWGVLWFVCTGLDFAVADSFDPDFNIQLLNSSGNSFKDKQEHKPATWKAR